MYKNPEDVKWGTFRVGELFSITRGTNFPKKDWIEGNMPIVTTTGLNNGVTEFISNVNDKVSKNAITVAGTGTVGSAFYQEFSFNIGEWVLSLDLKDRELNKHLALFLTTSISHQKDKYSYAYKLGNERLSKQFIMLPITDSGKPDWEYMESYMKELEKEVRPEFNFKSHEITDDREIEDMEWEEFFIEDLFEVQRGKRLIKKNQVKGKIPYISSTGLNNGVDNFISNEKGVRVYDDCLTVANSGSVGVVFFHPYKFVASDHVTHIKRKGLTKYMYLFIATTMNKMKDNYSFNREINDLRLKREKIILPVVSEDMPDWEFMEQYMKRVENKLMEDYK